MSKKNKKHVTFTLSIGENSEQISAARVVKELLKAVLIYAMMVYVPAAIVIAVLALIFKFNVLIPLLVAIPAALVIGVLIIVLSTKSSYETDRFAVCSKDFSENGFYSEDNLSWLLSEYERASDTIETGARNLTILLLSYHYKSDAIQQPQTAAKYLSEYYFDDSEPLTEAAKNFRMSYYSSAIFTYIHFDEPEKLDNLFNEASAFFEECDDNDVCKAIIRRASFYYFIYKNEYDRAAEFLAEESEPAIAGDMKAELTAANGDFDGARQILEELLRSKLQDTERRLIERRLNSVDPLERGEIRHLYDYIPVTNEEK